ncbi:MAG: NADH-quinone oxidoreductase subunit NuoB [Desulfobacterales bacterium]|nr:NADH-quinone oxidoreductase subunit NuoB [Desulfobacterales bacterium]MCF8080545.1 NADH-quinone oxidoreductase subunit NuoB [Desulfobacterales bacterium]
MMKHLMVRSRRRSLWMMHFCLGGCNGCSIEIMAALTPMYDLERFGILNTGNPKHTDVLLVGGSVNHRNRRTLKNLIDQIPAPRLIVAVGTCALTGGIFNEAYNIIGGANRVVDVDVYVPGCPPKPEAVIDGILSGLDKFEQ